MNARLNVDANLDTVTDCLSLLFKIENECADRFLLLSRNKLMV